MNRSPASVSQIGPSVDFSPPREIQQMMDKKKYSVSNNPESLTFSERQGKLMQRAVGRDKYMEFLRPCRHHAAEQQLRAGPVARPKYQSCGTTEPRSADKLPGTCGLPAPCCPPLAAHASAAQPEGWLHLETDREAGRRLPPETPHPSPLAERALRRQTPEVGAVCGKSARTDLCGGRPVMDVPTAFQTTYRVGFSN